jgi:hypothetical protein
MCVCVCLLLCGVQIPMGSMNEKFVFARGHSGPIEPRALVSFFDDFFAHTLPLFVRSQSAPALEVGAAPPTHKPGSVVNVFGSNFRDIVLNPNKDVGLSGHLPSL